MDLHTVALNGDAACSDLILAGNIEDLSQQLESATAMFNSQSAPSTARGAPPGEGGNRGHGETYPRQNAIPSQGAPLIHPSMPCQSFPSMKTISVSSALSNGLNMHS